MTDTTVIQSKPTPKLTKADFVSNQSVRWCPGCGDYSILANLQKVMPEIGVPKENIVFISGIGCSSRLPYYMNTFGFHTIHGRAPAVATGLKLANPELSVWVITGDGDALSIGGNHFIHAIRRNINLNILLFNNQIYGLTKGQYSPTSVVGKVTKSSPQGSIDTPLNPLPLALAAGASFAGRALDVDPKGLQSVLHAASQHQGTSVVEILQNCNIFNDGTFAHLSDRAVRQDRLINLVENEPMIYGKNKDKALFKQNHVIKTGDLKDNSTPMEHKLDPSDKNNAYAVASLTYPEFPVAMGVLYKEDRPVFDQELAGKMEENLAKNPDKSKTEKLNDLLAGGQTWIVKKGQKIVKSKLDVISSLVVPKEEETTGFNKDIMELTVKDLEPSEALIVSGTSSVKNAIDLMLKKDVGLVLVELDGILRGMFSEEDVLNKVVGNGLPLEDLPISALMSPAPAVLEMADSIAYAFNKMEFGNWQYLPVKNRDATTYYLSARRLLTFIGNSI